MYILKINPSYIANRVKSPVTSTTFSLKSLSPYMTQPIELKVLAESGIIPVVSWQLAMQIQQCRKEHPELKACRFQTIEVDSEASIGPARIDGFEKLQPGRLLLLTASLKRGLGEMLLWQPILRAQAKKLHEIGWDQMIGISCSSEFRYLFHGQSFIDECLPEMPGLNEVCRYDYFMEYGISLDRMKSLIGIVEWDEIDLKVDLKLPPECERLAKERFPGDKPKIFLHWESFDKQRYLPIDWFHGVLQKFSGSEFYCTLFGNENTGEIFPGGPKNIWPYEESMRDLFITLKSMDAVVTTNTGIAHAAAALGTPTIVLFTGQLYGWGDYWPYQYKHLYPTMHTIGFHENLKLSPQEIQQKTIEKLNEIISTQELVAA